MLKVDLSINGSLVYHNLAKQLSYYLYFFYFLFFLSWTYYIEGSVGKCYVTSVTQSQSHDRKSQHHITSHNGSHDRHGKVVHRPCSSCISSVENLMGTLLSSLCQLLNKEQLALFWLGVQLSYIAERIQEVRDEGKWVLVFFCDFVESTKIYIEPERSIFLLYEQNWHSVRRQRQTDESIGKIFVNEFLQCFLFEFGQGVDSFYRKMGIFFQFNPKIIRMVGSECFCFGLAKNISILVVSLWNRREVDFFGDSSGFGLYYGMELEKKCCRA